jgi:type IV pilus assembly protein PilQ
MNANNTMLGRLFFGRFSSIGAMCALLTAPLAAVGQTTTGAADEVDAEVSVTDYGTVDLAVQDTDLAQVLQMLSIQSRKNIITSKNVSATVTANLYDVTFHEALDAILRVNGYRYIEQGNFIYVYTEAEYAQIEKDSRKTESRIFELNYLSGTDANEFVTPLLSDVGQASFRGDVQPGMKPDVTDGGADSYSFGPKLVVNDYAENLDAIAELLAQLDSKPQQVLVEAAIVQTSVDESNAFGIDFSVISDLDFTDLVNPLTPVTNLLSGSDSSTGFQPADNEARGVQSNVGNTTGPGGLKIGVLNDDIAVFLRVLDEVTDNTVLARPKVMALNRQRAEVLVGARVGYLSTTATETTTTQTVEFLDTGIQLVFRPFISPDGDIRLELKPSVSEASLRTVTDANGVQVTIPDELTNEMTTNVRVRDGQTLVLGGLFRESALNTRRQIPILGDIPVLGWAFKGQDDTVSRQEIIFLITPSIMHDEMIAEMGDAAEAGMQAARVGMRSGLLGFSRERMIANHNQDAATAMAAGDTKRALHHVNTSLRLNARQPEVIKMREQLTGELQGAHDPSLLERAVRKQMGSALAPATGESFASGSGFMRVPTPRSPSGRLAAPSVGAGTDASMTSSEGTGDSSFDPYSTTPTMTDSTAGDPEAGDVTGDPMSEEGWNAEPIIEPVTDATPSNPDLSMNSDSSFSTEFEGGASQSDQALTDAEPMFNDEPQVAADPDEEWLEQLGFGDTDQSQPGATESASSSWAFQGRWSSHDNSRFFEEFMRGFYLRLGLSSFDQFTSPTPFQPADPSSATIDTLELTGVPDSDSASAPK